MKKEDNIQDFDSYIMQYVKRKNSDDDKKISTEELTKRMNTKWNYLKKRTRGDRKASRDFVLVLCLQLHLSVKETNTALGLLREHPVTESIADHPKTKEETLFHYLEDGEEYNTYPTIEEINNHLYECNLDLLDFDSSRSLEKSDQYEILKRWNHINIDSLIFNQYDSLELKYCIKQCKWYSNVIIKDIQTKEIYHLQLDKNNIAYRLSPDTHLIIEKFGKFSSSTSFYNFFNMLKTYNKEAKKNIYSSLDDTKNYKERFSAKFENNTLVFFYETFNYLFPQLNEYYFITFKNNNYEFSISNKSQFLHEQLGDNFYKKNIGHYDPKIICKSTNLQELINMYTSNQNINIHMFKDKIINNFTQSTTKLNEHILKVINKELFIRNSKEMYGYPDRDYSIAQIFNVENLFEFVEEGIFYYSKNDSIILDNVTITKEDLLSAFEFGLSNIQEIIDLKKNYGNINNFIESTKVGMLSPVFVNISKINDYSSSRFLDSDDDYFEKKYSNLQTNCED